MPPESKNKPSLRTSLFSRIVHRVSLPLMLLGAVFTAMQLAHQLNTMNEFLRIESRLALEATRDALQTLFKDYPSRDVQDLKKNLDRIKDFHRITDINVSNLKTKTLLFESKLYGWTARDQASAEKSFYENQENGKPYLVRIDRERNHLIAYMPIQVDVDHGLFLVARIIFSLVNVKNALHQSLWTLSVMFFFILLTGTVIARALSKIIIKPLRTLNEATREIMEGHLGKHVDIHTGDEIESLANAFNKMSDNLKEMKARAEDSNPLTQLPGNQGIFHELKKRIHERHKFVLFHIDINRFKVFNDHFGLARGDEVIKRTADLLKQAVANKGSHDDFVGHQGGDDFIVITHPGHANEVGEYICKHFDSEIVPALYRKEDLDRGYILQVDRRRLAETGEERMAKFPLLSVAAAGVSNVKKDFADYFNCMETAVKVKKEVKKIIESAYRIEE